MTLLPLRLFSHPRVWPLALRRLVVAAGLAGSLAIASAAEGTGPSATARDAADGSERPEVAPFANDVTVTSSFSSGSDLERDGKLGEATIRQYGVTYGTSFRIDDDLRLIGGAFGNWTDLDLSGTAPLPDRLSVVGLTLGATRSLREWIGPDWRATVLLRPNLSADSSSLSGNGFNVPMILSVGHRASATFSWDLGLTIDPEGRYAVLPLAGMRWDFAPGWTASVGFPQTGVAYHFSRALTFNAGARFQGGTYHVARSRGPVAGDTWLEYREVRLGAGFDYRFSPALSVTVDAGAVLDRRFDYFDRDYKIDGKSAAYVTLALRARF